MKGWSSKKDYGDNTFHKKNKQTRRRKKDTCSVVEGRKGSDKHSAGPEGSNGGGSSMRKAGKERERERDCTPPLNPPALLRPRKI